MSVIIDIGWCYLYKISQCFDGWYDVNWCYFKCLQSTNRQAYCVTVADIHYWGDTDKEKVNIFHCLTRSCFSLFVYCQCLHLLYLPIKLGYISKKSSGLIKDALIWARAILNKIDIIKIIRYLYTSVIRLKSITSSITFIRFR
jgi:hypothetical protein